MNRDGIEKIISLLSEQYGVKIRAGEVWAMDIRNGVLTYRPEDLLAWSEDMVWGILLHEVGHLAFTEPVRAEEMTERWFPLHNAFEDRRMEEKVSQSLKGAREFFEVLNGTQVRGILKRTEGMKRAGRLDLEKGNPATNPARWHISLLGGTIYLTDKKLFSRFSKLIQGTDLSKLMKELAPSLDKMKEQETAKKLWELLVAEVVPILEKYGIHPPPSPRPEFVRLPSGGETGPEEAPQRERTEPDYLEAKRKQKAAIRTLTKKLKSLIRDRRIERWGGCYRSGRIAEKRLYQVPLGKGKVFTKKIETEVPPEVYAFIVADTSGSMRCSVDRGIKDEEAKKEKKRRIDYLFDAIVTFVETCNDLNWQWELRTFGRKYFVKELSQPFIPSHLIGKIEETFPPDGGSNDIVPLTEIYQKLSKLPSDSLKLLIWTSDGITTLLAQLSGMDIDEADIRNDGEDVVPFPVPFRSLLKIPNLVFVPILIAPHSFVTEMTKIAFGIEPLAVHDLETLPAVFLQTLRSILLRRQRRG